MASGHSCKRRLQDSQLFPTMTYGGGKIDGIYDASFGGNSEEGCR